MRRDALLAAVWVAVLGAVTAGLAAGGPLVDLDLAVREWAEAHRAAPLDTAAEVVNRLGQGGALLGICGALAGWLALLRWWRRAGWWRGLQPLLYLGAATALVYLPVTGSKVATERGAPSSLWPPEQAVQLLGPQPPGGYADAYPSGHAVNTIVWYGVLVVLVTALLHAYGRTGPAPALRWVVRLAPPVLVLVAQTYLSFHWLTDSVAGFALGLAIDRVLCLLRRLE